LVGGNDLIFIDELAHACLFSGTQLSGARPFVFRHNDMAHLEDLLKTHRPTGGHALILTDGVFSMDGDLAPVEALAALANAHDAWLMTDDAHGIGVIGEGRGSSFVGGRKVDVPLQMGTLSKAVGGYGGYLCADQPVIDLMRTRARTVIYSTGLPPATIAAALKALEVIEANPEFAASPLKKANRFTQALGLPNAESPIVPLIMGDADITLAASAFLESEGFLVTAIRPPTVPAGTARLRFTFTAEHRDEDIDRLAALVKEKILNKRAAE
jgi:8-amino-7-oxononanoate synthase